MQQDRTGGGQTMRVLVTEDDEILAMAVTAGLRREGICSTSTRTWSGTGGRPGTFG